VQRHPSRQCGTIGRSPLGGSTSAAASSQQSRSYKPARNKESKVPGKDTCQQERTFSDNVTSHGLLNATFDHLCNDDHIPFFHMQYFYTLTLGVYCTK
jgi:hypothetical protein